MYQISRAAYRLLAPHVIGAPGDRSGARSRQRVLEACESTLTRMAEDRRHFAHPTRTLFGEIRCCFSVADQGLVFATVERYVGLVDEFLDRLPDGTSPLGRPRRCGACTRRGTPCRREPLPGRDYCPSHKHLEETEEWPAEVHPASARELPTAA